MINVIFAIPGRTDSCPSRVMFVARLSAEDNNPEPKRARMDIQSALSFLDDDKIGTIQPHDDALVVALRIGGYDVKRVMVDQDSGAEIIYPDLYKVLNLRPEDLTVYNSPLVHSEGSHKTTRASWFRSGRSRLHRGGRLFPLHSHCS